MKLWQGLKDTYWNIRHWMYFGTWPTPPKPLDPNKFLVVTEIEGIHLVGVHSKDRCEGRVCVVHNPTDHHMRGWTLHWRDDRGIFERLCPHGIGHIDPDQYYYWDEMGWEGMGTHGCDGCCVPPATTAG